MSPAPPSAISKINFLAVASAVALTAQFVGIAPVFAQSTSNADEGRALFSTQCGGCHSLSPSRNGIGPTLYHLFGRRAGSVPGYNYSIAMKHADISWNEATLQRFLEDPGATVPGIKMEFSGLSDPKRFAALLAYLRQATR